MKGKKSPGRLVYPGRGPPVSVPNPLQPLSRPLRAHDFLLVSLVALSLIPLLAGCGDNVGCVFTTGCTEGGNPIGPLGSVAALRPEENDWIDPEPPQVVGAFPRGSSVASTTPIVVVFSESVDTGSLTGAFQLLDNILGTPTPLSVLSTHAGGRVAVLIPVAFGGNPLMGGVYDLAFTPAANITDVTGQELTVAGGSLTTFTVTDIAPVRPVLVGTFPIDESMGESDVTEILTVFDRPVDGVTADSIEVQLDGNDPLFDPAPTPLADPLFMVPDGRVFTWQSVNAMGDLQTLGTNVEVSVTISPESNEITDQGDASQSVMESSFSFETSPVGKPSGLSILSMPFDGIGPQNLMPGDANEFQLQVDLAAEPGDMVDLFVFGEEPSGMNPMLFAVSRIKTVEGMGTVSAITFDATEADLTTSLSPLEARFASGDVSFAARLRRGDLYSAVTVLDVDPFVAGIQDPVLDLTGPVFDGFLTNAGGTVEFVSDQRDLVIAGTSSEEVAAVEVTAGGLDNGTQAAVLSTNGTSFLARPVALGVVDSPTPFTMTLFDGALNAATPVNATFVQRGRVGPGAPMPAGTLSVEVYDRSTLAILEGATVSTHSDDGATTTFLGSSVTDASGQASVTLAGGGLDTIVTVDLGGYDLWSFFAPTAAHLAVPLARQNGMTIGASGGNVAFDSAFEIAFLATGNHVSDSRTPGFEAPMVATAACVPSLGSALCPFGPFPVEAGQLGVGSYASGDWLQNPLTFDVLELLRAFEMVAPLGPTDVGANGTVDIDVLGAFPDSGFSESAEEVFTGLVTIDGSFITGIDLSMVDDEATTQGAARVTAEALVPGIGSGVTVGIGLSDIGMSGTQWVTRIGVPTSVRSGGRFAELLEDPDNLYVRAELRDVDGNRSVVRERETSVGNFLFLGNVPQISSPAAMSTTTGASYPVEFTNSLVDAQNATGFYKLELTGSDGRGWTVWAPDPGDGPATVRVVLPDLSLAGGAGLASGAVDASITAVGVRGLDATDFLWSDLERLYNASATAGTISYDQP